MTGADDDPPGSDPAREDPAPGGEGPHAPAVPPDPGIEVAMLLADAAQVAKGRLYVLGGGLDAVGPRPQTMAVALVISVPWDRANVSHEWVLQLVDEQGVPAPDPEGPLAVGGRFEAGRPAGSPPGIPLSVPLAVNFPTLPVQPGARYGWQLLVDDRTQSDWCVWFHVRT